MSEIRGVPAGANGYLSIREVLDELVADFDDVTISKIRFLESRGLIHPERTPSGYRKFYPADVKRLRWILRQQKDNFLPLKVIKRRLDLEDGRTPDLPDSPSLFDDEMDLEDRDRELASVVSNIRQVARFGAEGQVPPNETQPQRAIVNDSISSLQETSDLPTASQKSHLVAVPVTAALANGFEDSAKDDESSSGTRHPNHPSQAEASESSAQSNTSSVARQKSQSPSANKKPTGAPSNPDARIDSGKKSSNLSDVCFSIDELASATSTTVDVIAELEEFGFISSQEVGGVPCFDGDDVIVAKTIVSFRSYGLEPRHLKSIRHAAERDAALYGQVVTPLLRQRNPDARARAQTQLGELADRGATLYEQILRAELRRLSGG
ncbi:MAG TPA: MerR family transcriptional regulator [Acidimicrobiales bacterium]|nr:MerR family transcriptional regulator [Acidimicrobiales bacterium]